MNIKKKLFKLILKIKKPGFVFFSHNVTENKNQILPSLHLNPKSLEKSIKTLFSLGFDIISMETLISISKKKFKYEKPWVHFTFDDGYKENLSKLLPIFEKYNIPFTLFISSNHIDKQERFYTFRLKLSVLYCKNDIEILGIKISAKKNKEERTKLYEKIAVNFKLLSKSEQINQIKIVDNILSEEQKENLYYKFSSDDILTTDELISLSKNPLVNIGSHSHNHITYNQNVCTSDIQFELETSQKWLEKKTNNKVLAFCYPNGSLNDFNRDSISLSKKYYEIAFTTLSSFIDKNTDPYIMPRIFLLPNIESIINRAVFPKFIIKFKIMLFNFLKKK